MKKRIIEKNFPPLLAGVRAINVRVSSDYTDYDRGDRNVRKTNAKARSQAT